MGLPTSLQKITGKLRIRFNNVNILTENFLSAISEPDPKLFV